MDEHSFTAGITFDDDRVLTVDVTGLDGDGISYNNEDGTAARVPWSRVKAVMLATTDHMLESAGSLFAMAERLQASGPEGAQAAELRRFAVGILQQAAPRLCPLATECGLWPGRAGQQEQRQE